MTQQDLIPADKIESAIYYIRGEKVMLDRDLAGFTAWPQGAQASCEAQHRSFSRRFYVCT
jgi:hypothetical protein